MPSYYQNNDDLLLIGYLGDKIQKILIQIQTIVIGKYIWKCRLQNARLFV